MMVFVSWMDYLIIILLAIIFILAGVALGIRLENKYGT